MYIAPGQGQKTPWGQTFDVNRKLLSLCPFVAGLKKIALYSPRAAADNPSRTKF